MLAEMFFTWAADLWEQSRDDIFIQARYNEYTDLAWTALGHAATSPTLSPMVWYQEVYFELGQQLRRLGSPQAITSMQCGLRHDLHYYEGGNLANFGRDLAETYLYLGQFNQALPLLTILLQNNPTDVWTYNMMAFAFEEFGLIDLGRQAAARALALIKLPHQEQNLETQLTDALAKLNNHSGPTREAEAAPRLLAELSQALSLDFASGQYLSPPELARRLLPNLVAIPLIPSKSAPTLPPPPSTLTKARRNDPCWCGSGKKYKHCHLPLD